MLWTYALTLLLALGVTYKWPLWGYGFFFLSQTPLMRFAAPWVHQASPGLCLTVATGLLLLRQRTVRWSLAEGAAVMLTMIVFYRQLALTEYLSRSMWLEPVVYTGVWAPLLFALRRLDDKQMELLREMAVVGAIFVGGFATLGYVTGNQNLLGMGQWGESDASIDAAIASGDPEKIVAARYLVAGVFTYLPFAYWLVLFRLFEPVERSIIRRTYYAVGCLLVLIAVGISLTRGLLLQMGVGTAIVAATAMFIRSSRVTSSRSALPVLMLVIPVTVFLTLRFVNLGPMVEGFTERFGQFSRGDASIAARLQERSLGWEYLSSNISLFGAPGPKPLDNYMRVGDPVLPIFVWFYYGLVGLTLFLIVVLPALARIPRLWFSLRKLKASAVFLACLSSWALIYIAQLLFTGSYLFKIEVFFLMWFVAEVGRLTPPLPLAESRRLVSARRVAGKAATPA